VNILDNTLVAPRDGPIEYRVANIGEVLPAGGKVFTMLDASYVYMDIYLPTAEAGRVRIGSDARIVLDAYSGHVIPAKVVFVASQAQFTPKTVERRQADVPDQGANRSRAAQRSGGDGQKRAAGRRLCDNRSLGRVAGQPAGE